MQQPSAKPRSVAYRALAVVVAKKPSSRDAAVSIWELSTWTQTAHTVHCLSGVAPSQLPDIN